MSILEIMDITLKLNIHLTIIFTTKQYKVFIQNLEEIEDP